MGIGQAAGMAAALCVNLGYEPRDLPVRDLQEALLRSSAAIIPLFNLPPNHPDWLHWQRYYLEHPESYPASGNCPCSQNPSHLSLARPFNGIFHRHSEQDYSFTITEAADFTKSNPGHLLLCDHI